MQTWHAPTNRISFKHTRAIKPMHSATRQSSPMLPVLLTVGSLVARLLIKLGFVVLWFTQFGFSVNIRYGQYILTFDDMPVLGVDFSGCLFGSLIVVNSPFGWR